MGRWGDGFEGYDSSWGDVAAERNREKTDAYVPNKAWRSPRGATNNWQPPGHTRMFRRAEDDSRSDDPKRSFTVRKKHGWWGKEERYDQNGRRID